ncbi:MAG: DUF2760 domain-containing protein [Fibrobacterota bacterium]|nr:DUF2760 domain-containing protein [Fibrobacterota bacterium]
MKSEKLPPLRKLAWFILLLALCVLAFAVAVLYSWPGPEKMGQLSIGLGTVSLGLIACAFLVFSIASGVERMWLSGATVPAPAPEVAAAPPPKASVPEKESGAEALLLLSMLQEKGRFVDFLMEDIGGISNEQVGAAARVVHQGCRDLIKETFAPQPVSPSAESTVIKLDPGYNAAEFRVLGSVNTHAFQGKVVHKGWRASQIKLPRVHKPAKGSDGLIIVPAEVSV